MPQLIIDFHERRSTICIFSDLNYKLQLTKNLNWGGSLFFYLVLSLGLLMSQPLLVLFALCFYNDLVFNDN